MGFISCFFFYVCVLITVFTPAYGTFVLDGWQGPTNANYLVSTGGVPQAAFFNNLVVVAYRSGSTIYYSTSTDGSKFAATTNVINATKYDPVLVVVPDVNNSSQQSLLLIAAVGPSSSIIGYSVFNTATKTFPPLTSTSLTNAGGEVDAIYNIKANQLNFFYVSNQPTGSDTPWCWSATAVLSNGILTQIVSYNNLVGVCAAIPAAPIASFYNSIVGSTTFVQPYSNGNIYTFTTINPGLGFTTQGVPGIIYPGTTSQPPSVTAVTFTIGEACNEIVALIYISPNDQTLAYTIVTLPTSGQINTYGISQNITLANGKFVQNPQTPGSVFAFGKIFVYYMDTTADPPVIAVIYTTPTL